MRSAIFAGVAVGCSPPAPTPPRPPSPVVDATPVTQQTPPAPNAKIPVAPPCVGWCWEGPQGNDLVAVWAAARDDAWAVGEAGTVLHYDGTQWLPVPVPNKTRLVAVAGTGRGKVWVGGFDGVYAWENGAFVKRAEGMTFAIDAYQTDVWAGGDTLVHDAGHGFARIELPPKLRGRVTAIVALAHGAALVGIERATPKQYQPAALALVRDARVHDLQLPADMDQVIVDITGTPKQVKSGISVDPASLELRTSYPRVWVNRGGWVSQTYTPPPDPVEMRVLDRAVFGDATFAVGERGALSWFDGQQHDIRGSTIDRYGALARDTTTNELVMISDRGEVMRRGPDGFAELGDLARDRENAYVAAASADGSLFAVRRRMRDDGFSPSHSELVKWFGTGWTKLHAAPNTRIEAASASSPDVIWMAGTEDRGAAAKGNPRGVVLRFDGKDTKRIATNVGPLATIVAVDRMKAWIAGADGVAKVHVSGAVTPIAIPKSALPIRSIWVAGDDVYAIGARQLVRVHDGKAIPIALPAIDSELRAIAGRSGSDITIVADRDVLHFDGTAWRVEPTHTAESFVAAIYAANGTAIIASLRGAVLAHPPR